MSALKDKLSKSTPEERQKWYKEEKDRRMNEAVTQRRTFSDPKVVQEHGKSHNLDENEVDGFRWCVWAGCR